MMANSSHDDLTHPSSILRDDKDYKCCFFFRHAAYRAGHSCVNGKRMVKEPTMANMDMHFFFPGKRSETVQVQT